MTNCVVDMPGSPPYEGRDFYDQANSPIDPGDSIDLFTFTIPSTTIRKIGSIEADCPITGSFILTVDGTEVASRKTGPGEGNVNFDGNDLEPINPGEEMILSFTSRPGAPSTAIARAYIWAKDFPA